MRLVVLLVVLAVAITVLLPLLRRRPRAVRAALEPDELVKDPICQTYVVRSRAVTRSHGAGLRYFCSAECARRDAAR
jgi:hypothetical protein